MSRAITVDARVFRESVSEDQMQQAIEQVVRMRGGRCWHLNDARRAPELVDLPDLLILLPPRVILVELKSQRRAITLGQQMVLSMARDCGDAHAFCVRPTPKDHLETSYTDFLNWLGRH